MNEREARLMAAEAIAHGAARTALSYFDKEKMATRAKGPRDVVTAADLASEEMILESLRRLFPDDAIVAEEAGSVRTGDNRRWYIDPLDGTLNFSRGLPIWCISIALFESGEPTVGVIHDPLRDETFTAMSGSGAHCNGARLACSDVNHLSRAVVHVTTDFENEEMREGLHDLNRVQPHVLRTRNLGSAALGLSYVASGRLDAMIHRHANTWDFGAGVLLVREAGGVVTEGDGSPYSEDTRSIVAASGESLHAALLDLLQVERPSSLE